MLGGAAEPVRSETLHHVADETATGLALWMDKLALVGLPLALGLLTLAMTISFTLYVAVHWAWRIRIVRAWEKRRARRRAR